MSAAARPPRRPGPTNSQFFRPTATGRRAFSAGLLSISRCPAVVYNISWSAINTSSVNPVTTSVHQVRLTGLSPALASETISTDIHGNQTLTTTVIGVGFWPTFFRRTCRPDLRGLDLRARNFSPAQESERLL